MGGTLDMRGKLSGRVRGMGCAVACGIFLLLLLARTAGAVTFIEQANRLQLIYGGLLDFRPGQSPMPVETSEWSLGLELIPNPEVDTRIGAKDEPIDPPPLVPRINCHQRH